MTMTPSGVKQAAEKQKIIIVLMVLCLKMILSSVVHDKVLLLEEKDLKGTDYLTDGKCLLRRFGYGILKGNVGWDWGDT